MLAKPSANSVTLEDCRSAWQRIQRVLPRTPCAISHALSEQYGLEVYLKWENKLTTGSFKERGVVNFLSLLGAEDRRRGVCAASAGNHALALSYHAKKLGISCQILMPVGAPLVKMQSTQANGATVTLHGQTFDDAYEHAKDLSNKEGFVFVSAFDDSRIIAGQASAGFEILEQAPDLECLVVPIGGGGLISGIATVIKELKRAVHIIGVQSKWALDHSAKGKGAHMPALSDSASIADGIAVKKVGAITGPIVSAKVDKVTVAAEDDIAKAIVTYLEKERTVVEGAGAASLTALANKQLPTGCKKVVLVVSGSNIDMNLVSRLIERTMREQNRLLRLSLSVPDRPGSLYATAGIIAANGANVLEVFHDRPFSENPSNVDITFHLEVRNKPHKEQVIKSLTDAGIMVRET